MPLQGVIAIFTQIIKKIFFRFLKELATETSLIFSSTHFRLDFHLDYCKDLKILSENLEKIYSENIGRKKLLCFARSSLRNLKRI